MLLLLCWGTGVAGFFFRLGNGLLHLRRSGRFHVTAPAELLALGNVDSGRLKVRHPVQIRLATLESGLQAPITWGISRPVVLLPAGYAHETQGKCRAALVHELAHIARRDWIWLLFAQSLCALYWCVPFVWIAARRLSLETESACDDCVLSAGISAPDYADQILEVVRNMQTEKTRLPCTAMPMARRPLAEARIRAILDATRHRQTNTRAGLLLAALLPAFCIPILSLRVVLAQGIDAPRPVMGSGGSQMEAPSSAELTSLPMVSVPLAIHKPLSQPSLPSSRLSNQEGVTTNLSLKVLSAQPMIPHPATTASPDAAKPAIAWGPVVNGLQAGMRLVSSQETYAPGERIWQETYLRNNSPSDVSIQSIGGYESQGAPVIANAKGARVKVLRYFGMGMMFTTTTNVQPGEIALVGRLAVTFNNDLHPKEVAPGLSGWAEDSALALAGPGAFRLAQELTPFDAHDKPMKKTLTTEALPIRIANVPAVRTLPLDHNHIADLATAPIAWGAENSGLQVGLISLGERSDYFVGERVRVAVIVRNVSKAPITFWHQKSFAFLEALTLTDTEGKTRTMQRASEPEWRGLSAIRILGVTYDMTSAPSADGPSDLRQSDISPGQAILGYYLTSFVLPPRWPDGTASVGKYRLIQPVHFGLGKEAQLDTPLETGGLTITVSDPDGT